ncbi:MAG: hypothetical protein EHM93_15845 [Bacteroidales bacterium]|nr:MAG: hypothetical protein EHM93_15845 [Bacteroidales bacterium]
MKKKILFGLGALAIAAVLAVNVNMARNDQNVTLTLDMLGKTTEAFGEKPLPGTVVACEYDIRYTCIIDETWFPYYLAIIMPRP